jgi:hypothetical protein
MVTDTVGKEDPVPGLQGWECVKGLNCNCFKAFRIVVALS